MAKGSEARVLITPTAKKDTGLIVVVLDLPMKKSGVFYYGMEFAGKTMDVKARKGRYTAGDSSTVLDFGDFDLPGSFTKSPVLASLWGYDGAPREAGRGEVYMNKKLWFKCKWTYKIKA